MSAISAVPPVPAPPAPAVPSNKTNKLEKKPVKFSNLLLGAGLNMFEVTTLGQPLEVTKTTMAANRGDSFATALKRIWARGGIFGCRSFAHLPPLTRRHPQ
jgi:hypothetical protein